MNSPEYRALVALRNPPGRSEAGDMWLCRRIGIVRVFTGHKRGSRRGRVNTNFHMYHWGKRSLRATPCDWRDDDPNASASDPALMEQRADEVWEYLGNIFDMLPYATLAGDDVKL